MYENNHISDDLRRMMNNERIVWSGKPKKACFILECIFNPMLPFALIWLLVDSTFIFTFLSGGIASQGNMGLMLIGFFLIHLMPVWIYLGGIIFSFRKYKNTEYAITDRGIYVTSGCFAKQYNFKPFTDLSHVDVHRGIFDQWLGVGDVVSSCHHTVYSSNYGGVRFSSSRNHHSSLFKISDIPDYIEVCNLIKQYQTDIYADTQFPNDFRPMGNHGYRTDYYAASGRNAQNGYYNNQNYNNNNGYNNNGFYGENNNVHNGYEVNGGSNNYDSWDNPDLKNDKDSWDRH